MLSTVWKFSLSQAKAIKWAVGSSYETVSRDIRRLVQVSAYQRLEISHVGDPDIFYSAVIGEGHLLPGLLQLNGIDPLVVARITDVVEVVVHSGTAAPVRFVADWNPADVASIVVTPEKRYIIRDLHPFLPVTWYFLCVRQPPCYIVKILCVRQPTLYITHACGICDSGFPRAFVRADCCQAITSSKVAAVKVAEAASPEPLIPSVYMVLQFLDLLAPSCINDCTPPLLLFQSQEPFKNLLCSLSARACIDLSTKFIFLLIIWQYVPWARDDLSP